VQFSLDPPDAFAQPLHCRIFAAPGKACLWKWAVLNVTTSRAEDFRTTAVPKGAQKFRGKIDAVSPNRK
jgi:hypothetical protein